MVEDVHAGNSDTPLGYLFGYHIRGMDCVHRVVIRKVQYIVMDSNSRYRMIGRAVCSGHKGTGAGVEAICKGDCA
jgi:hypothetical protein